MSRSGAAEEPLCTSRLVLTPLRVEDATEMVGVLADPALYEFIGGSPPDLAVLRRRYEQMVVGSSPDGSQRWLNWIARLRDGAGEVQSDHHHRAAIGTVQATVMAGGQRAEIAWIIGTTWQGQGFAGEGVVAMADLLRTLGVVLLTAHIHPGHIASQAVARRAGLTPTQEFHDGEQRWSATMNPAATS